MAIRKEIRTLQPDELLAFRTGMSRFQANFDSNGYHDIAGYHGLPKAYCPHSNSIPELFLAWHRYYIYFFENELRKIDSNLSIPYWDWTAENTFDDALSPAHKDPTYLNGGSAETNPLYSALVCDQSRQTQRNVRLTRPVLNTTKGQVDFALGDRTTTFRNLSLRLMAPHNTIHTNVAGDFATTLLAAYDPLFWSHHSTIDRQWAIWQKFNPQTTIPSNILHIPLPGFEGKTIGDVIDYHALGYEYDILEVPFKDNYTPVILTIFGVHTTEDPYNIEIFLKSSKGRENVMAGIFGIFGMGKMKHGHHDAHFHHLVLFDEFVDIAEALKRLDSRKEDIQVDFVVKDENEKIVDKTIFKYESYEII